MQELFNHKCEVCGKEELITLEEGFNKGWDMPPRLGEWGVISPRTCGDCGIDKTAWWYIINNPGEELPENHRKTVERILEETGIPDAMGE